jgi:hypothetical protein
MYSVAVCQCTARPHLLAAVKQQPTDIDELSNAGGCSTSTSSLYLFSFTSPTVVILCCSPSRQGVTFTTKVKKLLE